MAPRARRGGSTPAKSQWRKRAALRRPRSSFLGPNTVLGKMFHYSNKQPSGGSSSACAVAKLRDRMQASLNAQSVTQGAKFHPRSHPDPLHLIEAEFLAPAVIELRRARAGMVGHLGPSEAPPIAPRVARPGSTPFLPFSLVEIMRPARARAVAVGHWCVVYVACSSSAFGLSRSHLRAKPSTCLMIARLPSPLHGRAAS